MGVWLALGSIALAFAGDDDADAPKPDPAAAPAPPAQSTPTAEPPREELEVVVYMKDGQRFTGILVSTDDKHLRVRIAGIVTSLPLSMVQRYEVLPPILQRYMDLRAAVGNDPGQILQLAEWLRERERYTLALAEVERALAIDPDHEPSRRLKLLLEQQIVLRTKAAERERDGGAAERDEPRSGVQGRPIRPRPADFPLLSRDQISLLKVYELDLDTRPRLVIKRETITRLLEQNSGHPLVPVTREGRESWYRKDTLEIMDLMFRLQARNLYDQVQVLDQPRTFEVFRDQVQRTWLLSRCATNECHGGTEAGRFMLHNRRPNSEQTVYTNFLIVNRFKLADGRGLIDVDEPAKSPLLQLGLPREDSLYPHPPVIGDRGRNIWRQVFNAVEDRTFQEGVEWVRSLFRPRPDYPIAFDLPEGTPRSRPREQLPNHRGPALGETDGESGSEKPEPLPR